MEDRIVPSTVQGTVVNDLNGNGLQDSGEQGLAGWTVWLDVNRNGVLDAGEPATATDAAGEYFFDTTNVTPGLVRSNATVTQVLDFVTLDLQLGSGGRWQNTGPTVTEVDRITEPNATRNFAADFQPYIGVTPVGAESLINANTGALQGAAPNGTPVASDSAGNYVVAWHTTDTGGTDTIYARVFNADGIARTGDIAVALRDSTQLALDVAMAGNGRFVVAWQSYNASFGTSSVMVQSFQSDGTPSAGPATVVAANSKTRGYMYDVAADATGNFAVLYGIQTYNTTSGTWNSPSLCFQCYTQTGSLNGKAVTVDTTHISPQTPGLGMDGAGNMVVVWHDVTFKASPDTFNIYAQRYTSAGKANGRRIVVASLPWNNGLGLLSPNVAMNATGAFVVSWYHAGVGDMLAQKFNSDGTTNGAVVTFARAGERPGLAIDGAGNATFTWTDARYESVWSSAFPTTGEVRMSRLTATGVLEPEIIVNTTTQGMQTQPGAAATGNGSFVVTWQGYGAGDDQGIFSQRYGSPLMAASLPTGAPSSQTLSTSSTKPLLGEAIRRWEALGVSPSALHGIDVRIGDLGGSTLGIASGHTITLDDNAAGWGWFVDKTPRSDSEFTAAGNQGEQNRMDLLTVLMHEVGHIIGYDHTATPGNLMNETLAAGTRENPGTGLVTQTDFWGSLIAQAQMKKQKSVFGTFLAGRE